MAIFDNEQELTTDDGQDVSGVASGYGTLPYDLKGECDPVVGEPLSALVEVLDDDIDVGTSMALSIVGDDDGEGTNEETLGSKTVLTASLTEGSSFRIPLEPGHLVSFLRFKWAATGGNPTKGALRVRLMKGSDVLPQNMGARL